MGSEMCIRDRPRTVTGGPPQSLKSCAALPDRTAGGSSPFSWAVPDVDDAALRPLSALPAEIEEPPTAPPLRRIDRLAFAPPWRRRGGVHRTPLRRTFCFGFPADAIASGRWLLSALLQERVRVKTSRHVEVVQVSQIVVQLIDYPPPPPRCDVLLS